MRETIVGINKRVNDLIAPTSPDRMEKYRDILDGISFDRALHFGSGRDKRELGTQLRQEGDVISLDPDRQGLDSSQNENKVAADGQRLPFKTDTFDLVFTEYVFEHLPQPELALREIRRVLKPGGSFVVLVPNPCHYYAKVADITPFWFHQFWFELQGVKDHEADRFPTQYQWGTYSDIQALEWGEVTEFHSFPGPTGYTMILPIHILFAIFDKIVENYPQYHVAYIAHYINEDSSENQSV